MRRSVVATANEVVAIATVLRWYAVEVSEESVRSKLYCPFGEFNHSDGGRDRALRIYPDSNTAYCFACSEAFTPVKLYARMTDDGSWKSAAASLLGKVGYRGFDPDTVWRQAVDYEPAIDRSQLGEALKTFCRRIEPRWPVRQFDHGVAAQLTRCLGLLDLVNTAGDAALWLARCKDVMQACLLSAGGCS